MSLSARVLTQASFRQEQTVAVLLAFVVAGSESPAQPRDRWIFGQTGTHTEVETPVAHPETRCRSYLRESDAYKTLSIAELIWRPS